MVARAQGHPEAALKLLEDIRPTATRAELESPLLARTLERFHRAELLQELGRVE